MKAIFTYRGEEYGEENNDNKNYKI